MRNALLAVLLFAAASANAQYTYPIQPSGSGGPVFTAPRLGPTGCVNPAYSFDGFPVDGLCLDTQLFLYKRGVGGAESYIQLYPEGAFNLVADTGILGFLSSLNLDGFGGIGISTPDGGQISHSGGIFSILTGGTLRFRISTASGASFERTITGVGTTGAQTINKIAGTVNFAAAASTLVVTNSLVTTTSIIFCTVRTNDATATIKNVVPAAGSFTITLSAAATAETSVGFFVTN